MTGLRARSVGPPGVDARSGFPAISVRGVSKAFRLPQERYTTLKERTLHPFSNRDYAVLRALEDVSFEVAPGEALGVVGRNGSGKSTLLKCLAQIYRVDRGEIAVNGRLAALIELGTGFHPELTARDNVMLSLVLLGLTPAQARARFDDVIAFAELGQFVDLKLKNFSSGMALRLGFAVTVQVDADILLFDEVLKVGDASFQDKCEQHFDRLKQEGRTLVFVSHDMESIERHCDRALLLDGGRVLTLDAPNAVADSYYERNDAAVEVGTEPISRATWTASLGAPDPAARASGPPAVGSDLRRLLRLTLMLAAIEFKLKYLQAALSYLWALVAPFAWFGIIYFVLSRIGRFSDGVPHYAVYLLAGLVVWMYFSDATIQAIHSLVQNESLLRRVSFPHLAIPLSVVLRAFFDLVMNSFAVLVFALAAGVRPRLSWLEVPLLMAVLSLWIVGVAMFLSAAYVRFRDVDHIWNLIRQVLFYGSPIMYVATVLPHGLKPVLLANPLAAFLTQLRHALIDPHAPTFVAADGGFPKALIPIAVIVIMIALGLWVFKRESPTIAENL
jgi:ABC-type polysaccharide/polyol phosphate transport system ATPase subunit/ABC-type polysaccharide/polyol phosphate export permease